MNLRGEKTSRRHPVWSRKQRKGAVPELGVIRSWVFPLGNLPQARLHKAQPPSQCVYRATTEGLVIMLYQMKGVLRGEGEGAGQRQGWAWQVQEHVPDEGWPG